jgi:electron transfer flavoprotein alpha subunit
MTPLRIAALVKQIPAFEQMDVGADGRMRREGVPLEMSAYCRRAVAEGVLLARETGGRCTVMTLGPPAAEDVLREALAYGADDAVLLSDPAFAGSDTLATAKALAAVLADRGPFDLVLVGRNSLDAETGQVGPQVAALLDLPFATGVKQLTLHAADDGNGPEVEVGCEQEDAWLEATVTLPAVLSTAERLIEPCKIKDPELLAAVDESRIERVDAAALGPGPWGQAGSPTRVGRVRVDEVVRRRERIEGPVALQVGRLIDVLREHSLLAPLIPTAGTARDGAAGQRVRADHRGRGQDGSAPVIAVLVEAGRQRIARELLGAAAELAAARGGRVMAIGEPLLAPEPMTPAVAHALWSWGADEVVTIEPIGAAGGQPTSGLVAEDIAAAIRDHPAAGRVPEILLAPSTAWGREVAARLAVAWDAGLTGDAVDLELAQEGEGPARVVAWKPAFGAAMVAAIETTSPAQLVTMRPGVLPVRPPRAAEPGDGDGASDAASVPARSIAVPPRGRVRVRAHRRDDDLDVLANARRVISVGVGVDPSDYPRLDGLLQHLGAELAGTRKVTDRGWLPHSRQVGITGANVAPDLALVIGASGKFNHMVGLRQAGVIVAVNADPDAPVFGFADLGLVADWREIVGLLEQELGVDARVPRRRP